MVALSSTEAEYIGATLCVCHCKWLQGLLTDLNDEPEEPLKIYCDNSSSIKLSKNPVLHRRTKHIDVRYHYLRDLVNQGVVSLEFCGTKDQLADVMTKPMKLEDFERFGRMLGMLEVN